MHRPDRWRSVPTARSYGLQQDDSAHEKPSGDIKFGGRGREEDRHRLGLITVVKTSILEVFSPCVCVCVLSQLDALQGYFPTTL